MTNNFFADNWETLEKLAFKIVPHFNKIKGKIPALDILKMFYASIDKVQKDINFSDLTQCNKQNCSFCCHDIIMGTEFEMKALGDYVKESKIEVNQLNLQKQLSGEPLTFAEKACPLLKNGRCSIYEVRPFVCRTHNISLGEDFNKCARGTATDAPTEEIRILELEAYPMALVLSDLKIARLIDYL